MWRLTRSSYEWMFVALAYFVAAAIAVAGAPH
jgi:hypothetical protein